MAKKTAAVTAAVPLKLEGKAVFFAGNFYRQDEYLRGLAKLEGGTVADQISGNVDFVVLGYTGAANPNKKAAKLNAQGAAIQILTIDQFVQHVKPTPDEGVKLLRGGPKGIERWNRHWREANRFVSFIHQHPQSSQKAYIRGADFSSADLSYADLGELVEHSDFTGANLTACQLNLAHCQLAKAKLVGIVSLYLVECAAEHVDFRRMADRASVNTAREAAVRLHNSRLQHAHFEKCSLDGADFSGVDVRHTMFQDCSMKGTKLASANLEEAELARCDLRGADFTNANLKLAILTGANVDGADFTGATMVGADVARVDFSKAKGFDSGQVQARGGPGRAVKEFLQAVAQAQHACTSIAVIHGDVEVVLRVDHYRNWIQCSDSAGNYYYHGIGQSPNTPTDLWSKLVNKWHGATPELASVKMSATKAPQANKELKQLALRAWCEYFGIDPPDEEELKKAAKSAKAQKQEKADEWLALLRQGKKSVERWNENVTTLTKMLDKALGVDLAGAKLGGIKFRNLEWKQANLSGADLAKAEVIRCRFPEADVRGANLCSAMVNGSSFADANLENADATSASMAGTSFRRAVCKGAKFTGAKLQHSDFCGTDLTGADLAGAVFDGASYDEHTRWPNGFSPTLEMAWKGPGTSPAAHKLVQSTRPRGKLDVEKFMQRLEELTDSAKLAKALSMLKADRFRLYAQVGDDHFVGVVKSQSDADLVYSCRLNADGTYACCTQNLNICGGLRGSLCKHLLVLIVGLTKSGELDPNVTDAWIRLSKTNKPALDKDAMSETFLRYKGAEAGEVDWRPTETIPEDYYAM
jgi:uncharacterized protein YjbI with pentapeptide repeats